MFRGLEIAFSQFPSGGLKELSFIHFARWVIVPHRKFPRITSQQPKEDLQYDYLLFFSNFNGTWNRQKRIRCSRSTATGRNLTIPSLSQPLALPITTSCLIATS